MPKRTAGEIAAARPHERRIFNCPRRGLERFVETCLKAKAEDSRLGDLSELYGRAYERARSYFGNSRSAMTMSCLAADMRYLSTAFNVILFARAVDPRLRLAEPSVKETITRDLRERTMAMLHTTARKLVLPALLFVASAFLVNGAVNVWTTWRETEALMVGLQREKAEAAATQIQQYVSTMQDQIGWTGASVSSEQRRADYLRLLRQVPAIVELSQLNAEGKEVLKVSRMVRDTVESGVDFSTDTRFTEALKRSRYVGPVYFNQRAEPYLSLASAHVGANPGVTLAEVNVKRLWDLIDTIKVGETGYAYVVDGNGRLIASRDRALVVRQADLSALPQVIAASAAQPSEIPNEALTFDTSPFGAAVLSVHAAIPTLGWKLFVELPLEEARAPLWNALSRAACLLGLGLLAIILASLAAARRDITAQPVRT